MAEDFSDFQIGDLIVGEYFERGQWIHGEQEIPLAIKALCGFFIAAEKAKNIAFGKMGIEILDLDNERCPAPPEGNYVGMVVGFAKVQHYIAEHKFTMDLDAVDLGRIRGITRKEYQLANPLANPLTDIECDKIIDEYAPGTAEKVVQQAVDSKMVH